MEIIKKKNGRREIDLATAALLLLQKAWIIIIVATLGGVLSLGYSMKLMEPKYEATATLYVSNTADTTEIKNVTTSDLSASMMLMYTCSQVIMSEDTMDKVIALSGVKYNAETLLQMIHVSGIENTKIMVVTATSNNAKEAALLANAVAEVAPDLMKSIENGTSVRILNRARIPVKRSSPSNSKTALLGAVIGGFVSVLYILLKAVLDTKIKKKQDIVSLGYPLLGVIQDKKGSKNSKRQLRNTNGNSTIESSMSSDVLREFTQIEENVLFSLPGNQCKKIVVTGITPGDDISKTSANLAAKIASDNYSVLLMDCNLQNQEIADFMRLQNSTGVSNVLVGHASVKNSLQYYNQNLQVMTSGVSSPNPSELLSSEEMQQMLKTLEEGHDFIVLNTAPLGNNDQQQKLYKYTSGTILVVRRGVTRRDVLKDQLEKLEASGCRILGLIAVSDKKL